MKKQLLLFGIVVLLVCVGLSGCNQISNTLNSDKSKFVGTWKTDIKNQYGVGNYTDTYIFFSDGTLSTTYLGSGSVNIPGSWEIKDGKLVLTVMVQAVYNYSFSNNDHTLTLTPMADGESQHFYKQ